MTSHLERLAERWTTGVESFFERPWEDRSRWERVLHGAVALTFFTTREIYRDRSPMMAAGLAFFTVLAVVPLLTVAASLMAAFGLLDGQADGLFHTIQQAFPDVASGVASYLQEIALESAQAVGGIGAITLLIIGLVLFNAIEETLTKIWQGSHDRSLLMKMLTFHAVITFGPLLIALSIVQTAGAQFYLTEIGIDVTLVERAMPILYALVAFTLLFKLVPNAVVTWKAALIGALFAAIAFELAKWGFNLYVNQLLIQTYDRVYGTLALIPIALIWMYIVWLVILVGAELAYSFQFLRDLMHIEGGRRSSQARKNQLHSIHPLMALEVLAPIIEAFDSGQGPVTEKKLARSTKLPTYLISDVVDGWIRAGVIVEAGTGGRGDRKFLPARPPEDLALDEFIEAFWVSEHRGTSDAFTLLSEQYLKASKKFFDGRSGKDLIGTSNNAPDESADGVVAFTD